MNLSYLSFYSQYLNSPIIKFHKINAYYKIYITFFILIVIPYINNLYIIYTIIGFLYISSFMIYKSNKDLLVAQKKYIFILTLVYNIYAYRNYYKELSNYNFYQNYYIPYNIKSISFKKNDFRLNKLIILFIYYSIPIFIIKIYVTYLLYLQIINLLFISTRYEHIILFFLKFFQQHRILQYKNKYSFILLLSFTSHFLERTFYNLDNIYCAIQFKYNNLYNINIILYQLIHKYIFNILNDTYSTSSNLWNREIIINNFSS